MCPILYDETYFDEPCKFFFIPASRKVDQRLNTLKLACFNVDPIPNLNKIRLVAVSSGHGASSSG
jgi:hypothetical protein